MLLTKRNTIVFDVIPTTCDGVTGRMAEVLRLVRLGCRWPTPHKLQDAAPTLTGLTVRLSADGRQS
jgi:hypothetical protein